MTWEQIQIPSLISLALVFSKKAGTRLWIHSRYWPPDVGAIEAISAKEAASAKVKIHEAKYIQIVPARPPLVRENALLNIIPIHVDIVVIAKPNTDKDLKFRRNSCDRPIRAMSKASASVPVAVPVASTRTLWSECSGLLIAGLAESLKLLPCCIPTVAMVGEWKRIVPV